MIKKEIINLIATELLDVKNLACFKISVVFIVHYFVSVSYMPSCVNGSRNFKMTKLEEPRRAGIPVAHMGMGKK